LKHDEIEIVGPNLIGFLDALDLVNY